MPGPAEHDNSPVERVLERSLVADSGLGKPLSHRAATTQRTVEAYLKAGVKPRWMERVVEVDQGIGPSAGGSTARTARCSPSAGATARGSPGAGTSSCGPGASRPS